MKVACFTYFVPRRENINGPSGLLYQTLKSRPPGVLVTVFLFGHVSRDYRDVPEVVELESSGVQFVPCVVSSKRSNPPMYWPLGARQIAKFEMPDIGGFDAVWAYPYWFAPFLRLCQIPVLISGMDCATLLYWRRVSSNSILAPVRFLRAVAGLMANALFEIKYLRGRHVHVVGQADAAFLKWFAAKVIYIPHPVLDYPSVIRPVRHSGQPLTFLLSNPDDPIYGSQRYLRWVQVLFKRLNDEPGMRLIVHKGSPDAINAINLAARQYPKVKVDPVTWVNDYTSLLSTIDIQIFPLDIGAGTKTSVLTAVQHGVRAICSPVAAENVQPSALLFVANHRIIHFEEALERAMLSLRNYQSSENIMEALIRHSPVDCGSQFWSHLENNVK